ncbi:hypothetical protein [Mitsuaria sp. GD03876]|uniref:hypothetical protein n=1 Tax=Mitsuaria sp. GD03876 TaxID=2975399 RepID=UPI00244996E3|nr:hypothetical protein [Mitsuaria sp. GD03876]MDH0863961.1 hypothetical protein [Mitsuaria sp. GD03876]
MPIDCHDLLDLARHLSASTNEATLRASISRGYYAAYYRCLEWERQLPKRGDDNGIHGVHACLISRLQCPHRRCSPAQARQSRAIGKQLREQRDRRTFADYEVHLPLPRQFAAFQLQSIDGLFNRCKQSDRSDRSRRRKPR